MKRVVGRLVAEFKDCCLNQLYESKDAEKYKNFTDSVGTHIWTFIGKAAKATRSFYKGSHIQGSSSQVISHKIPQNLQFSV